MNHDKLREMIRMEIQNMESELDEITTSAAVPGYLTPKAFAGEGGSNAKRVKDIAKKIGYKITNRGKEDMKGGDRLHENYHEYKNDPTKLPHQKIGEAISEINKQLKLVERMINMNTRLQKETGTNNDKLWKRTQNQLVKLEGKLMGLAGKLREMRK